MSQQHWENYYRSGALATAPMDANGGFDQEIALAWEQFFRPLPVNARVLDIGTGNGIVLAFASRLGAQLDKPWRLFGTDLAQIDPMRHVAASSERFHNCRFFPGVATEALPFEADYFDAVCGHYALEYSDEEPAISEIARVLKPDGVSQFLVHHASSELLRNATKTISTAGYILRDVRIYQKLKAFAQAPNEQASLSSAHTKALRTAIQQLKKASADHPENTDPYLLSVVIEAVGHLLVARAKSGAAASLKEIDRAESDLRHTVRRLKDLLAVAKSEADISSMISIAENKGLRCIEREPQLHGGTTLVGWRLKFLAS